MSLHALGRMIIAPAGVAVAISGGSKRSNAHSRRTAPGDGGFAAGPHG